MKFLLCNDDGYDAIGINLIAKKLKKYGEVIICAPSKSMSAKSCSITFSGISYKKINDNLYVIEGTPADCVGFGLSYLKIDCDIVIAGCNHGLNISYDTMYSGTIGACLEALRNGKPAIAFSADSNNFELVDKYLDVAYEFIIKNNLLSKDYFCNVNFPITSDIQGISLGKLYYRKDKPEFIKGADGLYYPNRTNENNIQDKETDCYQIENGIISVVPIYKTYFNEEIYNVLKKSIK